ncbi:MAG: TAXI family TRAP transporter solute-binding subunit [Desulfobacterales bacterium]|nr:TAXI family TRAP transporter solute-binding subunit [Desulfobacterales bacterium]
MKDRKIRWLFFSGVLLTSLLAVTSQARARRDILIGGGAVTGVYYQVALQTCAIANKYAADALNCVGRPALGSVFNINAVDRGLLDFGVCQSDRNYQAWNGEGEWQGKSKKNLRSVFSMHPEFLYLMVRKDAGIQSVMDLKGKRVNIGNPGSGQRGMALDVLRIYGMDPDRDIQAEGMQQSEASRALIDKKVDAFFYSVGLGASAIEEPATSVSADLISINSAEVKKFVAAKPYYVMARIPAGSYKGVQRDTETYAVKATLVASAGASDETVYAFTRVIFEHLEELKKAHAAFRTLSPPDMLKGLTAPLHPGAARYYRERGWM